MRYVIHSTALIYTPNVVRWMQNAYKTGDTMKALDMCKSMCSDMPLAVASAIVVNKQDEGWSVVLNDEDGTVTVTVPAPGLDPA